MTNFIIDEPLANTILNYLAGKPYGEVYLMINSLQKLQKVEPPKVSELKEIS